MFKSIPANWWKGYANDELAKIQRLLQAEDMQSFITDAFSTGFCHYINTWLVNLSTSFALFVD